MAPAPTPSSPTRIQRNARYGLILFVVYLALYAGFMAVSVLGPREMAVPVLFGMNLAIVYGFVLIVAALVLALVYMALCSRPMPEASSEESQQ
ncbi:MAG: DUF485 domain-containing protein [Polyangiaceae bacterium]|nr:DUF485 domain-containing protein [Polyangiaceae bacterium]